MPNISESDISQTNVSPSVPVKHSNPLVKILIGVALLGIGVGIGWLLANNKDNISLSPKQTVSTYDDCIDAKGSTVQESYPATCVTRDGTRFTQPLTDEEKQNLQPPDSTANWKTLSFQPLQLSLKVPSELTVHTEEPNPGNDFTAYIQNYTFNAPPPRENPYQLYIVWQKTPIVTQIEFQQLKNDLDTNSVENTVIASYPAIKGQVKGERNRFVDYILKGNTKISLFTSGPTQANKNLTDQILSTFKFLDN